MYSTIGSVRLAVTYLQNPEQKPSERTGTAADLDNEQIADAINEADAMIDAYIGTRYVTPVVHSDTEPGPHPIDYWSRNIAAYNATLSYRGNQDFSNDDPVARRYNATMTALTAVRDGKATLPIPITGQNTSGEGSAGAGVAINPYDGALFDPGDFDLTRTPADGTPRWWATPWGFA